MAMSILPKFLTLKWNISRTIWRIDVGDGSFFAFFTLFHLSSTFFRPEVPFKHLQLVLLGIYHLYTDLCVYINMCIYQYTNYL